MCTTCGQRAARLRIPGVAPGNPIVLGDPNGRTAQTATFVQSYETTPEGSLRYVTGDGVEQAVEDGLIKLGYNAASAPARRRAKPVKAPPEYYVQTSRGKWIGFVSKTAAARYAKTVDSTVQTRAEVLSAQSESSQ